MTQLTLKKDYLQGFLSDKDFEVVIPEVQKAHRLLEGKKGLGAEFTGWADLPSKTSDTFLSDLKKIAQGVQKSSDALVTIGIGGSYLGIRAAEEFLSHQIKIPIYYAGQNLSADYHHQLLKELKNKKITAVVISKSGTTTEPALVFRIVKKFLQQKYSAKELKKRIICVTDEKKGALRRIAKKDGYQAFVIDR